MNAECLSFDLPPWRLSGVVDGTLLNDPVALAALGDERAARKLPTAVGAPQGARWLDIPPWIEYRSGSMTLQAGDVKSYRR